jgi:hypothetical protein
MLPPHTLDVLSEQIVAANTPAYVWRKLSESASVQHLAAEAPFEQLLEAIAAAAASPQPEEHSVTLAYACATALVLRSKSFRAKIAEIPGSERLLWLRRLSPPESRSTSATVVSAFMPYANLATPQITGSSDASTRLIISAE